MTCDLTIIIPVFNCEPFLLLGFERLKKLYDYSFSFEIIYVNDGSTDNSLKILKKIEEENKNIIVLSQENQGSSGARNTAIEVAKGSYIQFLDADDILDIDRVVKILNEANQKKLDLIGYRLDYVDENYDQISVRAKHPIPYDKVMSGTEALIYGYQPSSICVFLFKTSLLIDNNLRIFPKITHMDVEFMSRVMLLVDRVKFKDIIAYHYLQRQGSITKPKTKEKLEKLRFDETIIAGLMKANIQKLKITEPKLLKVIKQNYNSVVWNLIWVFFKRPKELDKEFKKKCLNNLKENGLYPIKGPLKTKFQKFSTPFIQTWLKLSLNI